MGFISAIIALLRAVPSLERLFLKIADGVKEAKVKARYDAKLTHIDNAMRLAGGVRDGERIEWSEDADRSPPVSEGGTIHTRVDEGSTGSSSGTRIRD